MWLVGAPAQLPAEAGVEWRSRATPAGEDFAGAALPSTDARALANATPLSLKRGCAWGVPGAVSYTHLDVYKRQAVNLYPYYDASTGGLAFEAMLSHLQTLPERSVVLLHACCHNPTGVDLTRPQWDRLIPVLQRRRLLPYLDLAYQGYGEGIEEDAAAVRQLADSGLTFFVANSFSKSMSCLLYTSRCV